MLRFAPSLTADMHIDDLRVALFNSIVAAQKGEDLIVRIDDADKEKNIEDKDKEILDILALFGIDYTQVIYQSQNVRFHSAMALQLLHEKKAFSCFCSPNWIEKKQEEAKKAKKPYKYDDACRNLSPELVIDNTSPFTIRINRPDGDITLDPDAIDSFIIMNQDKTPTYNFACAIDDMLSDISIVICDEGQMSNTLKQERIREQLSYDKKIEYVYLPSILSENDKKMSEDDDGFSVKWLLEKGYLPEAILNYLILTAHECPQEIFSVSEAKEWFDVNKISKSSTLFDLDMLKHINREHLKALDVKELSRYVGFADEEIGELSFLYLEEVGTTKELKAKIYPIFEPRVVPKEFAEQTKLMAETIKNAPYFEEYEDFKNHVTKESGLKGENYLKPIRILLTNAQDGPDLAQIYKYIKNYLGEIIK
ncbi:MAG: glutamate--tRNA ligase [Sulfurimonas sp.]